MFMYLCSLCFEINLGDVAWRETQVVRVQAVTVCAFALYLFWVWWDHGAYSF